MIDILIVDDEKIERNGIRFLLKQCDFQVNVREAVNGVKALEELEKQPADILLTDIKMPFMDGLELVAHAVEKYPQMKMIIFSGYGEFEYARKAMKSGVHSYILKPVDPVEFKNTMSKVIQEIQDEKLDHQLQEKSRDYMQEHIVLSLLNGISQTALESELGDLVDMSFLQQYSCLMLVEFDRDFFGKKALDFKEQIQGVLGHRFMYLNLNPQQCVLFFQDEKLDRSQIAHQLQQSIANLYMEKCYIAVSDRLPKDQQVDLAVCYEQLELLMENKFYLLEDRVFINQEETVRSNLAQIDDDTLMKQIRQDIKRKDMVGLRQHFEGLCEKYQSKKNFSQVYVKFVFSNLLKDIYEILPADKRAPLNKEIDLLYRTNDFLDVMNIINVGIQKLEESFSVNPQMVHREIETVKRYIYENYDKELSVDMLADQVYLAPSYLSHIFKKETGQNLSKFIKALRMEKAKEMLEETHNKIVNISYAVGYPNVSYFCQSFREYYGVSPQKYRNQGDANEETETGHQD